MDVAVPVLVSKALGVALGVVVPVTLEDDLRPQVLHRFDLHRVGHGRRADHRAHAEQARRVRDRLAVVAGRSGYHAAPSLVLAEPADQVDAAPHLERPGRVVILVLDVHLRPDQAVERRVTPEWGRLEVWADLARGVQDVGEGRLSKLCHRSPTLEP